MNRIAASVEVWRSYHADTDYSVSLCDSGGEIRCVGGADDLEEAWQLATETADDEGIPAQIVRESGEVTRTYRPEVVS